MIEGVHRHGVEDTEERLATLKETKKQVRTIRDGIKDLFELLLVDEWPKDLELDENEDGNGDDNGDENGEADLVHQ